MKITDVEYYSYGATKESYFEETRLDAIEESISKELEVNRN